MKKFLCAAVIMLSISIGANAQNQLEKQQQCCTATCKKVVTNTCSHCEKSTGCCGTCKQSKNWLFFKPLAVKAKNSWKGKGWWFSFAAFCFLVVKGTDAVFFHGCIHCCVDFESHF